jgi:hypothetical protein
MWKQAAQHFRSRSQNSTRAYSVKATPVLHVRESPARARGDGADHAGSPGDGKTVMKGVRGTTPVECKVELVGSGGDDKRYHASFV